MQRHSDRDPQKDFQDKDRRRDRSRCSAPTAEGALVAGLDQLLWDHRLFRVPRKFSIFFRMDKREQ